jgi:hypothetical protein
MKQGIEGGGVKGAPAVLLDDARGALGQGFKVVDELAVPGSRLARDALALLGVRHDAPCFARPILGKVIVARPQIRDANGAARGDELGQARDDGHETRGVDAAFAECPLRMAHAVLRIDDDERCLVW